MSINELLDQFTEIAASPAAQLKKYKSQGKKAIGVLPYYAPDELVHAAGMVPFGMWGSNKKTISRAKEYCATFYCTIAQLALEMLLDGTMDDLDGIITPVICDTLRPMSQNFRVAMEGKMPTIFLAHPQNRFDQNGKDFTISQYTNVKNRLEEIAGTKITDDALRASIKVYNQSRAARRRFVKLAGEHPDVISAVKRSAVLKSFWFMMTEEHTALLTQLNDLLEKEPACQWKGAKIVTSGIICDNPVLLKILDDNKMAIVADDVAHESRMFKTDAAEDGDPMQALADQFADIDHDVLLYDPQSNKNRRAEYVADLVEKNGAGGLILFMQQFCDPEEMEYPYLKKELDARKIPHIKLGVDQQMRDFGQAETAIQAFADIVA
ncbi:MAG: 2-hydroxyacyl-CoA dehydratase [Lachnospiraceae bacterium]|nr:2-hydroxyacyl-CoA dehydratase [Lachnospiraceae bacterium]